MSREPRAFSVEEIAFLKEHIAERSVQETVAAFNGRFAPPATGKQIADACRHRGLRPAKRGSTKGMKFSDRKQKPVGSENIVPNGDVYVKAPDGRWRKKMRLVWEEANGPIPANHAIVFLNGNKLDTALSNLLLVSPAELAAMVKLGLFSGDPEATRLGHAVARLRVAAGNLVKEKMGMRHLADYYENRRIKRPAPGKGEDG